MQWLHLTPVGVPRPVSSLMCEEDQVSLQARGYPFTKHSDFVSLLVAAVLKLPVLPVPRAQVAEGLLRLRAVENRLPQTAPESKMGLHTSPERGHRPHSGPQAPPLKPDDIRATPVVPTGPCGSLRCLLYKGNEVVRAHLVTTHSRAVLQISRK